MIADLRRNFNKRLYSPEKYQQLLAAIDAAAGVHVEFRHSETPVFLEEKLLDDMSRAGKELLAQVVGKPNYLKRVDKTIPGDYYVNNETPHPLFVQADFGIIRTAHGLEPRLVEIQGFPSLYGYQTVLAEAYRRIYGLDPTLRTYLSGLDRDSYWALLRHAILGDHAPENVVLMEIYPERQKTQCDFNVTSRVLGIPVVCLTKVINDGLKLFYERDGKRIPIHRIYNRVIVDELDRLGVRAPFDWSEDLEVEWAGHPNWYFRLSKYSLPYFDHPFVPKTQFLSDVRKVPSDLPNWVLKPLFSFAGHGVSVGPTREEIEQVKNPENWILQERVQWDPVIDTPFGPTMIEVRVMYIWLDGGEPMPVNTIIRSGRGKMMGVDHNKNMEWVGASAAFY